MNTSDLMPPSRFPAACRALLLMLPCLAAYAETREAGTSYFDDSRYIEYIPGDMPLVITAPHGGTLRPAAIPDRSPSNSGCPRGKRIVTAADADSDVLARELQQSFFAAYGRRPHVVIAHISRRKVDLNREPSEAACGDAGMEAAWRQWHAFVQEAVTAAAAQYGGALYIDLHGHGHARQRLEIGYGLGAAQLAALAGKAAPSDVAGNDDEEDAEPTARNTLANLPLLKEGRATPAGMLSGPAAFGTLAAAAGLDAVPSAQTPYPQSGEPYFSGGYNARRYTSERYPTVFGWQIETHRGARLAPARAATARALMEAITQFLSRNTGLAWQAQGKRP